ncbi:MAG: hypothetical protein IJW37_01755 [Lachnospiraceae bacterium]|nr:hypothetical protein [Lachnospiraceae bacterium]
MKLLIGIRLKSMFYNMQKAFGGKKKGTGALVALLIVFVGVSVEFLLFGIWSQLSMFFKTDFAWLFFAMAALLAFAFGIFGTVFTTQSQMYQAKDNELLLAMPLKPSAIIGSRVVVLYLLTFVFVAAVMAPAGLVYCMEKGFSVNFLLVFVIGMLLIALLTQAVTCLLGWILHFLLAGFKHKAIVATIFMTAVMVLYFIGINQLENLMLFFVNNGGQIASAIQSFAWPFYAFGVACLGNFVQFALFAVLCLAVFGIVTAILNVTFVKAMLVGGKTKGTAKQKRDDTVRTPMGTVCRKEAKRFFSSTAYLVNIGMGLFMIVAFVGAGVILKGKLAPALDSFMDGKGQVLLPAILVAAMGFLASMMPISAPSVSLEGKHIWILRSMPISGADVLKAKLRFHCVASVPIAAVGTLVLGIVYGIGWFETIFATLGAALLFVLCGILGIVFNMCFPRLDWPNEAAPCKQSMAIFFTMFGMIFICIGYIALMIGLIGLFGSESSLLPMVLVTFVLMVVNYVLYRVMVIWGGRKFETL